MIFSFPWDHLYYVFSIFHFSKSCQHDQEKSEAASKIEKIIPIQKPRVKGITALKNLENNSNKKMLLRNKNQNVNVQEIMDPSSSETFNLKEEKNYLTTDGQTGTVKESLKKVKNEEEKQELMKMVVEDMISENIPPSILLTSDLSDLNEGTKDEEDKSFTDNIMSLKSTVSSDNTDFSSDIIPKSVSDFKISIQETDSPLRSSGLKETEYSSAIVEEPIKVKLEERRTEDEMVKITFFHQRKSSSFYCIFLFVYWLSTTHFSDDFQYFDVRS